MDGPLARQLNNLPRQLPHIRSPSFPRFLTLDISNLHQYQQKQASSYYTTRLWWNRFVDKRRREREMTLFSTVKETTLKGNQQHGQLNAPCCTLQQMGFKGRQVGRIAINNSSQIFRKYQGQYIYMLKRGVVVQICWVEAIIINLCLLIARVSRIEVLLCRYTTKQSDDRILCSEIDVP